MLTTAVVIGVGCSLDDEPNGDDTNPAATDLMAHFKFDGDAIDASGNDNHGQAHAVVATADRNAEPGKALYFDGEESYVAIPFSNSLSFTGAMTLSLWAKGAACDACNSSHVGLISKRNVVPFGLAVDDGDRILLRVISEGIWTNTEASSQPVEPGSWVHYAGVYEPMEFVRVYRNGVMVAETTEAVPPFVDNSSRDLWIGTRGHSQTPDVPLFFFQGSIDDVRMYSRALDADEIAELAQ